MFPNVRLLIGALFASFVALSCGFGVFAAFRVNHDPLSRLPGSAASLQLVADEGAQPRPTWGVSVQSGSGATPAVAALIHAPMPVRHAAIEPPAASASSPATMDAVAARPQAKAAPPIMPSASAAPIAPAAQTPAPAAIHAAAITPVPAAPAPAAVAPPPQTPAAESQSVSLVPAVKQDTAASTAVIKGASAETAPVKTAAERPEPAKPAISPVATKDPSADMTGSVMETAALEAPPIPVARPKLRRRIVRKPVERRHIVLRRRVVHEARARAATQWGGQNSIDREPVFQSGPNFQQSAAPPRGGRTTKPSVAGDSPAWPGPQ